MSNLVLSIKKSQNSTAPTSLANGELAYSYSSNRLFIGQTSTPGSAVSVEYIGGNLLVGKVANLESQLLGDTVTFSTMTVSERANIEELALTDFDSNGLMYTATNGVVLQTTGTSGQIMQVSSDGVPVFGEISGGVYTAASTPVTADYTISVTNNGAGAYTLSGSDRNGSVSGDNASLNFNNGDIVDFTVNASGHPFWIKTVSGTGTDNQASGVTNGGAEVGTVRWVIGSAGTFYYVCQYHASMVGTITVS